MCQIVGDLLGVIFGCLFGTDKDEDVKPIKEDIRKIANNTAELVAIDKRLINAPAGLTLPATATAGGAITYNVTIPISGVGDPSAVANEVARVLNSASSYFNIVNDTLS